MRRITCRRTGSRSSRASSTAAGTSTARRPSPGRRRWASSRRTRSSRPSPTDIKDWDKLTADEKRLFARQMEVFAAFAAHTDNEIGRVVKAIEDIGELDNTLILYVVGDNGASAEGGMVGMFNEMTYFNGVAGDGARHAQEHRQVGRARDLPAHGGGLGRGRQHAVHVDQAGGRQLRRHAQPARRAAGPRASRPRARSAASSTT